MPLENASGHAIVLRSATIVAVPTGVDVSEARLYRASDSDGMQLGWFEGADDGMDPADRPSFPVAGRQIRPQGPSDFYVMFEVRLTRRSKSPSVTIEDVLVTYTAEGATRQQRLPARWVLERA